MIDVFVSRPNWVPSIFEKRLPEFYNKLTENGFSPHTIGKNHIPIQNPFDEVRNLMNTCECSIILGIPQIFLSEGSVKGAAIDGKIILPTEWNYIEATMSLMLGIPTLAFVQKNISCRGIFERGASNLFIHEFDIAEKNFALSFDGPLKSLSQRVKQRNLSR